MPLYSHEKALVPQAGAPNTPGPADSILDQPGLEGSFQQLLADNLGRYVQIDFLVGVQTLVRRSGVLYAVGRSFVVLYDEESRNFVMCDVYSAKFVSFFAARPKPGEETGGSMGILNADSQGNLLPVSQASPEYAPRPNPEAVQPAGQLPPVQSGQGWVTLGDWRDLV